MLMMHQTNLTIFNNCKLYRKIGALPNDLKKKVKAYIFMVLTLLRSSVRNKYLPPPADYQ